MKKYILSSFTVLFILGLLITPSFSFAQVGDVDPNPSLDCVALQNNLRYRDRDVNKNGEVSTLQDFLQSKNYLNSEPTGYFGILTLKAVKNFQRDNGISPTGYVGSVTGAKIKALSCGSEILTYIYKNHGFSIELPKLFTPKVEQATSGPAFLVSLPTGSLTYVTDSIFWEKNNIPSYTYIKDQKIGVTTFKVYSYLGATFYWFKKGNVGYEFGGTDKIGLENLLKTFRFVGWSQNETMKIKVFFHNKIKANDPDFIECGKVFSVERIIPKTASVARAALMELFKGPSESEKIQGYTSNISTSVILKGLTIKDGVAYVDLNKPLNQGGSCAVLATWAAFGNTLKQFPSISEIKIFVNGVDQTENSQNP